MSLDVSNLVAGTNYSGKFEEWAQRKPQEFTETEK